MAFEEMTREQLLVELRKLLDQQDEGNRARREERRRHKQFEQLDQASLKLTTLLAVIDGQRDEADRVLQLIVDEARVIADAAYAAIGIGGHPDHAFEPWMYSGIEPALLAAIGRKPRARGALGEVMRLGRPLRLRDVRECAAFVGFPPQHPEMHSFLGVPVSFGGDVVGHLYLANKQGADEFSREDAVAVEMFAQRAGVAMQLARLARDLRASIASRDNLLAVVSHDLRGPVSTIQLSAELLTRISNDSPELRRPIDMILRSGRRITQLIDDLLQAATIEAGTFTVVAAPHEVLPTIQSALDMLDPRAAERSIRIERELPAALPRIACDERRLVQVLGNLVGNAIKFARDGGRVRFRAWEEGREVRFAISDDGPGIAPDQVPHLFERYWKGSGESRRGTGLGLYIVKGIVDAHAGRVWVDTKLGAGSTFTFTIPIADPRAPQVARA
jgi:signal transduction histidine kinase